MKKFLAFFAAAAVSAGLYAAGTVDVSFQFTRSVQPSSNQFAVWVEDSSGNLVKTLFVTRYTAHGGYSVKSDALTSWVKKSNIEKNPRAADGVTGATPKNDGTVSLAWDCTGKDGKDVKPGIYTVRVEGTVFQSWAVYYSADVEVGGPDGQTPKIYTKFTSDQIKQTPMIENVKVAYKSHAEK